MNFSTNSQVSGSSLTLPEDLATQPPLAELVFTQDVSGRFLSFDWRNVESGTIEAGTIESRMVGSGTIAPQVLEEAGGGFAPVAPEAYADRIRRVLETLTPERFRCYFRAADRTLLLDLVATAVLVPSGAPNRVVVAGQVLADVPVNAIGADVEMDVVYAPLAPSSDRYQKLLTQIAWNVRRKLDLATIWQQTVKGLGKALGVSRCVVCPYEGIAPKVKVVAEYCAEPYRSMLGAEFWVTGEPHISDAIATLKPLAVQPTDDCDLAPVAESPPKLADFQHCSMLIIATCYKDQPNGLIMLHQCDRRRIWSQPELEFMQELADQVGTAIAHASLFAASQSLANELQRVNSSLLQKHRELEEARQQAEEASRLKSEFLANTSHELRTPLNGMIGFLKLIMDGMADDPEEQMEFINEAYRSALHLLNIINDVLDIAKIEAGKLQIELSPVKLPELLDDVRDFTGSQIHQKQLNFVIQKPPTDDEILLYGNYQRLLQVMLNLVGNAIKFTHEGSVTISVEVIRKKATVQNQELPGMVKVRVADTGIGVSLDKQDKLFQSFSQVDGSRTRQYGGTGLGLAISQKLVEAMGGEVNFYSLGEGLGSTVTFTVPLFQEPIMISSEPPSDESLRLSETLFGNS